VPASLALLLTPWGLALVGLCVGSFLNVVTYRLPLMLERRWRADSAELLGLDDAALAALPGTPDATPGASAAAATPTTTGVAPASAGFLPEADLSLTRPASRCPHCGHRLRWHENIPVLSWLWLRGRCSACGQGIGLRYPLVEAATGLLFAGVGLHVGPQPVALLWCGVVATLLAMALIDWDTTLLPDDLTQPLLWAGLIAAALGWTLPLPAALWGAVAGYLSLWLVTTFFKLATGKVGMGEGDFKLLAALGAWLGAPMILPIVLGASVLGALVGIAMKLGGTLREGRYVPFGPFLAGAGLVVLFAGQERVMGWLGWY
jgi:leader peptidase (prepilin peptidase)/N-methyltransferase